MQSGGDQQFAGVGQMACPIGQPPLPFVNLNNHPSMQAFAPLPATAQPTALAGQIPLAGMPGLGHLNLAPQAMIPGLPPIVVTAVVMPNGAAVHPIQQLGQQKRLRSHATPLTAEEALHAAKLEGLTLHVAPSTKTGYKGTPGPPRCPRTAPAPAPRATRPRRATPATRTPSRPLPFLALALVSHDHSYCRRRVVPRPF